MTRILARTALCTALACSASANADEPADGIFDTWGLFNSGKTIVTFDEGAAGTDIAADSVVGPDGSMYLAGTVTDANGKNRIGVAKLLPNGDPDTEFSGDGKNISLELDVTATAIALTADNRLLVAGYKTVGPNDRDFIVCRFSALSGANLQFPAPTNSVCVKPTFLPGTRDEANDIAVDTDGSFVIAGTIDVGAASRAGFARFLADGQPDLEFGNVMGTNIALIRTEGVFTKHEIEGVAIAANGRIVGVGNTVSVGDSQVGGLMIRLEPNGTLDGNEFPFFSPASPGGNTRLHDLVLVDDPDADDDAIIGVGHADATGGKLGGLIVKIKSGGGSLDSDFGNSPGYTKIVLGAGDLSYRSVAMQPGSGYVVVGQRPGSDVLDLEVRRFTPNGSVDSSFGTGGNVVIDLGTAGAIDLPAGVSVHRDGVYFSGYSYISGSNYDMVAGKLYLDRIFENGLQ